MPQSVEEDEDGLTVEILHKGFLARKKKRGNESKYFVLCTDSLRYYDSLQEFERDYAPQAQIMLYDISELQTIGVSGFLLSIGEKELELQCVAGAGESKEQSFESWRKAFETLGCDFSEHGQATTPFLHLAPAADELDDPEAQVDLLEQEATKIQAAYRGSRARAEFKHEKNAAVRIQAQARGKQARAECQKRKQERDDAVVKIQAQVRGNRTRAEVDSLKQQRNAAVKIQASYRGRQGRQQAEVKKCAVGRGGQVEEHAEAENIETGNLPQQAGETHRAGEQMQVKADAVPTDAKTTAQAKGSPRAKQSPGKVTVPKLSADSPRAKQLGGIASIKESAGNSPRAKQLARAATINEPTGNSPRAKQLASKATTKEPTANSPRAKQLVGKTPIKEPTASSPRAKQLAGKSTIKELSEDSPRRAAMAKQVPDPPSGKRPVGRGAIKEKSGESPRAKPRAGKSAIKEPSGDSPRSGRATSVKQAPGSPRAKHLAGKATIREQSGDSPRAQVKVEAARTKRQAGDAPRDEDRDRAALETKQAEDSPRAENVEADKMTKQSSHEGRASHSKTARAKKQSEDTRRAKSNAHNDDELADDMANAGTPVRTSSRASSSASGCRSSQSPGTAPQDRLAAETQLLGEMFGPIPEGETARLEIFRRRPSTERDLQKAGDVPKPAPRKSPRSQSSPTSHASEVHVGYVTSCNAFRRYRARSCHTRWTLQPHRHRPERARVRSMRRIFELFAECDRQDLDHIVCKGSLGVINGTSVEARHCVLYSHKFEYYSSEKELVNNESPRCRIMLNSVNSMEVQMIRHACDDAHRVTSILVLNLASDHTIQMRAASQSQMSKWLLAWQKSLEGGQKSMAPPRFTT